MKTKQLEETSIQVIKHLRFLLLYFGTLQIIVVTFYVRDFFFIIDLERSNRKKKKI